MQFAVHDKLTAGGADKMAGWKIALTGAINAPLGTPPSARVITGATLIDGRGGEPADAEVVEVVKWRKPSNDMRGVPVWERGGILCTGETYKDKVKLTFAHGASLDDPNGLFNSSLEGNTRRAIDIREGDKVDAPAFKALVKAAVAVNATKKR